MAAIIGHVIGDDLKRLWVFKYRVLNAGDLHCKKGVSVFSIPWMLMQYVFLTAS
jgi:hypothetical protein